MAEAASAGRAHRIEVVTELRGRIRGASGLVFLNAQRLDAAETAALRHAIRPTAATLRVVKNRLMRIACNEEQVPDCGGWLEQNTAIAFLGEDPVTALKALATFAGDHDKLVLKGGLIDGRTTDAAGLKAIAALPGRRELLTRAATTLKAPLTRVARDFRATFQRMALLLAAAAKKAPQGS